MDFDNLVEVRGVDTLDVEEVRGYADGDNLLEVIDVEEVRVNAFEVVIELQDYRSVHCSL